MTDRAVPVAIDVVRHRKDVLTEITGRTRRRRLTILNTCAEHDRPASESAVSFFFRFTKRSHEEDRIKQAFSDNRFLTP